MSANFAPKAHNNINTIRVTKIYFQHRTAHERPFSILSGIAFLLFISSSISYKSGGAKEVTIPCIF